MSDKLNNPHDQFFRAAFSRPDVARSFLTNYLPIEIVEKFDLDRLEITQESFVDDDLKPHHTDLLFRLELKSGGAAFVYVLLEHKSYPDELAAFQVLKYLVRIWEKSLRSGKTKKLPPVLPVVLYHGKTKWQINRQFADLFENADSFARFTPHFEYELCDLSEFDADKLKGEAFLQATVFALQNAFSKTLAERIFELWHLFKLKREKETVEFIAIVVRYLLAANDFITADDIKKSLKEAFPEWEEIMTQAYREILQQGIQQGIQQGGQQQTSKIAVRLLEKRFGAIDADSAQQIQQLSLEKAEQLSEDLLDFTGIEDLTEWLNRKEN